MKQTPAQLAKAAAIAKKLGLKAPESPGASVSGGTSGRGQNLSPVHKKKKKHVVPPFIVAKYKNTKDPVPNGGK
jgi:hypothetical protein